MQNPQGNLVQAAVAFGVAASAHRHGGSDAVGVDGAVVDGAIPSETHANHIELVRVAAVMLKHPVNHLVDPFGLPCPARVLRRDNQGVDLSSHGQRMQGTVTAHLFQVVSTQAGAMQEKHHPLAVTH